MTSYRQLQSDDVSDQFDLDAHHSSDGLKPREEVEVQIEPSRTRTKSRVRFPNTNCTKNKVIAVLAIMLVLLFVIASVTIYELDRHGVRCHDEGALAATTASAGTTSQSTVTTSQGTVTTTQSIVAPTVSTQPTATDGEPFPWNDVRLPTSAIPFEYEIFLHPNLTTFEVHGNVTIHINTDKEISIIILHAKKMTVAMPESVQLVDHDPSSVAVTKLLLYKKNDQLAVYLDKPIPGGVHCILTLAFNYTLGDELDGFYRSSYKKESESRNIASTQFESTSARMAFPCFDEPALKARFSLRIVHDPDYTTLFNMPALTRDAPYDDHEATSGLLLDSYNTTVRMSTYLVAFVVSDFGNMSAVTTGGTQVAVYASAAQLSQAQLALDVVKETIPYYEQLFNITYPLPKQDMIAIPDFSAGAMENWGLITYREESFLYKENVSSSLQEAWIVITITHELAHQWFGNLVTMAWWSDLWLNEGFASFVEYIGADHFRPEWKMMDRFILETTQPAMSKDQQAFSHPISVEVKNPDEISEIFDTISYSKGATILKMLQSFLMSGDQDVMMLGIQDYLKKFKFGNAVTSDLWDAISKRAGQEVNVTAMMDTWTLQMGFPVVNLTRKGSKVIATQQRFLIYPEGNQSTEFTSPFGYKWTIPLTYFTEKDRTVQSVLFDQEDDSITLNVPSSNSWYKLNSGQSGMYRVNYDAATWDALVAQLQTDHSALSPADRSNLLRDAFSLAWAGYINYSIPLNMTRYMIRETDYVPMETGLAALNGLGELLYGTEYYAYYKDYMIQLFSPRYTVLGKTDSGEHLDRLLRQSLLATFRYLGHVDTLEWASQEYDKWMQNNKTGVGPNLRGVMQCGGIQNGNQREWEHAWQRYLDTTSPSEKGTLLSAMACTQDPGLLTQYLQLSLDRDQIRLQDAERVIGAVARHPAGFYLALSFVINNWDVIRRGIGNQPFVMTSLIVDTTWWISNDFEYKLAKNFFDAHKEDAKQGRRSLEQAMEDIRMKIAWRKKNEETVSHWFKDAVLTSQSTSRS